MAKQAIFNPPVEAIDDNGQTAWLWAVDGDDWLIQRKNDGHPIWLYSGWGIKLVVPQSQTPPTPSAS